MMSDEAFRIGTFLTREEDDHELVNFEVTCRRIPEGNEETTEERPVAKLMGFVYAPGYYPDEDDEGFFEACDARSAHTTEAHSILIELKEGVLKRLQITEHDVFAVAVLEDGFVEERYRGNGLILRLMREVRAVLGRDGVLVILKAHPTEKESGVTVIDEECRRLARYYLSDERLSLMPLLENELPGWLVAFWAGPEAYDGDDMIWAPKRKKSAGPEQ